MASRAVQGVLRTGFSVARNAIKTTTTTTTTSRLNKKFDHPFTFEEAGPTNAVENRFSTWPPSRPDSVANSKSAFTTVAAAQESASTAAAAEHRQLHSKFRVPFDENPLQMQEDFIEQVESIPLDVQKERGYHIIGKIKATSSDSMQKILALGDMRIYQ
jgi:hypothetical protein